MTNRRIFVCCALFPGMLTAAFVTPAAAADLQADYLRGLRTRRLFTLAETWCEHRLQQPVTSGEHVRLTVELAETFSQHAQYLDTAQQAEYREKARLTCQQAIDAHPDDSRRLLLELELARIAARQGNWLRWQAELTHDDPLLFSEARDLLQQTGQQLTALAAAVDDRLQQRSPRAAPGANATTDLAGTISPEELRTARLQICLATAGVFLDLADVLSSRDAARTTALQQAEHALRPLEQKSLPEEFIWQGRVFLIRCQRLLGQLPRAESLLREARQQQPSTRWLADLAIEDARLLAARGEIETANQRLDEYRAGRQPPSGELALVRLQLAAGQYATARRVHADTEALRLRTQMTETVEDVRQRVGGFWSYRCELVLDRIRDLEKYGTELAPLIRRAQSNYAHGRVAAALEDYGQAAVAAHRAGQSDLAFDMAYTRASLQVQQRDWAGASTSLLELARRFPDNRRAAEAHVLAIFALGQMYDDRPTRTNREQYTAALEQHPILFPDSPTVFEATWRRAMLAERRAQVTVALDLYRQIPLEHERGPVARLAIARCYDKILQRLAELGEPDDEWRSRAIDDLAAMLPAGAAPERWELWQTEIAVALAEFHLGRSMPDFAVADRLLAQATTRIDQPATEDDPQSAAAEALQPLKARAIRWRVVSLAGQGQPEAARKLLEQLSAASPQELLQVIEALAPIATGRQRDGEQLAQLRLQAAIMLDRHRARLSEPQQRKLDECLAEAYESTGQVNEARAIYDTLLKASPRNITLLRARAGLLLRTRTPADVPQAQADWRLVESLSRAGSDDWLDARYHVCLCLQRQKKLAECVKLIRVTRLLYPKLGGESLSKKFAELEKASG